MGALLIRHDKRLTVCRLIEGTARTQLGQLIPIKIPSSTKVNQSVILKKSIYDLDRTSKVARAFGELAQYVVDELEIQI
jgi:chromosome partitioning protein